jgi:sugar phosphate isomerase/epimerase
MYFSMKSIGFENEEKIKTIKTELDRWQFLYDIAKNYGFEGIQIDAVDTAGWGLDLNNIPEYFEELKLTFHFGGHYKIMSQHEYDIFNRDLSDNLETALKYKMHDISIHPLVSGNGNGFTAEEKKICGEWFDKAMTKWVKETLLSNISFSVESHVYGGYFLFDGLHEYANFVGRHPNLGALIDISHNYHMNFSEDDIIHILGDKNVTGLHISDALQNVDVKKGTHLAIGEGTMDFEKLLKYFGKISNLCGALELIANNDGIDRSLKNLKKIYL